MAGSNRTHLIGVIAEERNDVDVLYQLTCKLIRENSFAFKTFIGHGCGKIRRNCRLWAETLIERGCKYVVVLHDLDRHTEADLRRQLERDLKGINAKISIVLIPAEEIEAWLLSDPDAIKVTFRMRKVPKISTQPETIRSPKEFLGSIVEKHSKTTYLNTIHNKSIATNVRLAAVNSRCPSFLPFPAFIKRVVGG